VRGAGDLLIAFLGALARERLAGAISMVLCVVSRRTSFIGREASGFTSAPIDSACPAANGPLCRSVLSRERGDRCIRIHGYLLSRRIAIGVLARAPRIKST
jgi:hypothetical protein